MPSLISRNSDLANTDTQIKILEKSDLSLPSFSQKLREIGLFPLKPQTIEILQVNLGKMCNQTCHHCHVDAGPDRKEIMSKDTLVQCLEVVRKNPIPTVDLTGGAPEMNPHFRWFVSELKKAGAHIINRCNLTILLAHQKFSDLPQFFAENEVEVVSSLPHYSQNRTDRQRGDGVFQKSIQALKNLNQVGYGLPESSLQLNLVHNPAGCFLPHDQKSLEREFKRRLLNDFGVHFSNLYCITNMPISRYLEYLLKTGNYESYMNTLVEAFNPVAAKGVMCRNTISVGWDGKLYDCDFNQMLNLQLSSQASSHIEKFDIASLNKRNIIIGNHCFGCTAGSGSSCGGTTA